MFKKILVILSVSIFSAIITACTSVQLADKESDASAKSFAVEKGMSHIYIYRNETENFNTTMSVDIDGSHVGDTEHRTYIAKTVSPGKHVITAHAENTSEIELTTEADKNYFVWLEVTIGAVIPRAELQNVSKEKGHAGVNESNLVK